MYSIQPSEMELIHNDDLEILFKCIPMLQAQEALVGIKIAEYPNLKAEAKRKLFKDLKKQANPQILKSEARPITMAEIAKLLKE